MKKFRNAHIIDPTTRRLYDEGRQLEGYSYRDFIHGYIYARWPYLYIGLGTREHPFAKVYQLITNRLRNVFASNHNSNNKERLSVPVDSSTSTQTYADGYHGKVVPLEAASQLVTVDEPIEIRNLEKVIPYTRARDIILQNPDHIVVLECPCRTSRPNPCLPLDVCLIIGEPFAGFVAQHHSNRSRWISSKEALNILKEEDERDHVHHAFFKDAMLGRFYAICNCCSCCCGAMQAHRNGTPMLASSGYVCEVDPDICIGCGECLDHCQFSAITLEDFLATIDDESCMGCGICISNCEQGSLSLRRDINKSEPLELISLLSTARLCDANTPIDKL